MWQRPFYHEGMSELQDRFDGRRVAEAIERHPQALRILG